MIRYGFTSDGDGASLILDGTNQVLQQVSGLPGGATYTVNGAGESWSYPNPNPHGDISASVFRYDPFGQSIDPTTGKISTTTADQSLPDTAAGNADFGRVGTNWKLTEHGRPHQ